MKPSFITGEIETSVGKIPQIATTCNFDDYIGTIKVRSAIGRGHYSVKPGLYAIGCPTSNSEILVTANYKLSFDVVRRNLNKLNVWLLVLDTKGVNVWCAAGKKTFGTDELVHRISVSQLNKIVTHRRIIVPQLGAPGISAFEVRKKTALLLTNTNQTITTSATSFTLSSLKVETGFKVIFGPVRASDIKQFLESGFKATAAMRTVHFNMKDRAILIPVEVILGLKYLLPAIAVLGILSGLNRTGLIFSQMLHNTTFVIANTTVAYMAGTIFAPLLLPYIPFRSFSLKGASIGIIAFFLLFMSKQTGALTETIAWLLIMLSTSSFLTMNFTGTSNYTSLSGVLKEMKIAVPIQIGSLSIGIILFIISKLI